VNLDAGTFLLQWATGGLAFCWLTTRRREVGVGYGWLLRITYLVLAIGAAVVFASRADSTSEKIACVASALTAVAAGAALAVSVVRRRAGVSEGRAEKARRATRVAAMAGRAATDQPDADDGAEFPPVLDLAAPIIGAVGLLVAADVVGGPYVLAAARLLVGAAFIGAVTDAMLLGHWYLVQPGLRRDPVKELVLATAIIWPLEVAVFLVPEGMVQVLSGTVDDGYGGLLGWVWVACAITTIVLVGVTWAALKERSYSAVMAATGLLYLAILTAFGTDLIARAVLSG
jgi:hypothetical protein